MKSALLISSAIICFGLAGCQSTNEQQLSKNDIKPADAFENLGVDPQTTASIDPEIAEQFDASSAASQNGTLDGVDSAKANDGAKDKVDTVTVASVESSPPSNFKNGVISAYVPPKKGTIFTWRNNWASLPEIISYKVDGVVKLGDTKYVKLSSVKGLKKNTQAYYDLKSFSLKGYRDAKNAALVTYKPAEARYRFPMKAGDKWVTAWKSKDHKENKITKGGGVVQVVKFETLKIAGGKYQTAKVKMPLQKGAPRGMTHHIWFSPKLGVTVKEQIGSG
ncbi:MAG: hypothetical protein AB8B49_01715, partial [Nitratireductor sp.]